MCKICIFVASIRPGILCSSSFQPFSGISPLAFLFHWLAFVYHFDLAQFVTGRLSSYGLLVGFVCLFAQPAYGHQQVPGSTLKDLSPAFGLPGTQALCLRFCRCPCVSSLTDMWQALSLSFPHSSFSSHYVHWKKSCKLFFFKLKG